MYRKVSIIFSLVLALAVVFSVVSPAVAQPSIKSNGGHVERSESGVYIVQMIDDPVVAYEGNIKGLKATAPNNGQKIDKNSSNVKKYVAYLDSKHDAAINKVGGGEKLYDYHYSFNGFAAALTYEQASKLAFADGVVAVSPDQMMQVETVSTPAFLGLSDPGGLWDQLGGVGSAGEDVIVGVVDTGIWPENPSFSDQLDLSDQSGESGKRNLAYGPAPAGWSGDCQSGEQWSQDDCNNKIIGARYYLAGFGHFGIVQDDFKSARDYDGHGSHTASTAAGNNGVTAIIDGVNLGTISGMAPRARIAAYKVCWNGDDGGCVSSDSVAAIDQAVADGVDVINFSISGSRTSFLDPVEVAFLFAARAGVFVAASAGNEGPGASTVAHNSPWLTTVAAGTHDRFYEGTVTLGNGDPPYIGASATAGVGPASIINSDTAGLAGADPGQVALCYPGTLDPAIVAGKIVVCDRGVIARVDKSLAVQIAGGVGMVLVNVSPSSLNADIHFVPTVHLADTDRAAVRAYAATPGATATLTGGALTTIAAPDVAAFSSRGPALAGSGDLLKPDIMAPGVDILAAYSPAGGGRSWDFLSGTSMSSPHMAGMGALMKDLHPTWSPAAIKSAFMTTATTLRNDFTPIPGTPFGYGAGQAVPNNAADPGLVYDAGFNNWLAFLCGTGQLTASYCPSIAIDPSNLNYPSISIGALAGVQTVTRTVKNVGPEATYNVSFVAPAGIGVAVDPASFTLASGATQTFTVTFTANGSAVLNDYAFGSLTWSDGTHNVTSPLVIRPVALSAPTQVSGTGGPINYNVTFGYTGPFTATARGLVPATTVVDTVVDDPTNNFVVGGPGTKSYAVVVPAGTTYARFSLFDANVSPASDLDLYVYNSGGTLVGASGSGTSNEEVNLLNPAAGTYTVWVHGWQTGGPSANFTLFYWVLGSADAGNMLVSAPASATTGTTGVINLTFSGLTSGTKYLGSVVYSGVAGLPNPTIVRVDKAP